MSSRKVHVTSIMPGTLDAVSPCVVSTLWDVTDKEVDGLAQRLVLQWWNHDSGRPLCSLPAVLPHARQDCALPHLTGAATVCYGLPVLLRTAEGELTGASQVL
eukprot:RCo042730